jgi:hypothetical protein
LSKPREAIPIVEEILSWEYFQGDDPAIPYVWTPGHLDSKLLVVTGENGGGKSFFRRCLSQQLSPMEMIPISMEGRRGIAYNPILALVYGSEQDESTGSISARTVSIGIKTCRERETSHAIFWDEPDLGLSEGASASVGKALQDFASLLPAKTVLACVVSHSKALLGQLETLQPHYLYLGDQHGPQTLTAWLTTPPVIRTLEEIDAVCKARWASIQKALNRRRSHSHV